MSDLDGPGAGTPRVEDLLRRLAPQVLGAVVRRYGRFDAAEDATQEALLAAATQWPVEGVPDNPRAWLVTVAARRLTDLLRTEQARQRREDTVARWTLPEGWLAPAADRGPAAGDDSLVLLFLCCHPALTPASQIALTLRAVGGLTTAEIARAFLTPEDTMTRRITRAKRTIKDSGVPFALPSRAEQAQRLGAVLHVLYLVFNEGYVATAGSDLHRVELSAEAIRLARMVHRLLPGDSEVAGLLALMLLTDARRPARTGPDGDLVPMEEQDRSRWNADHIAEGVELITAALPRGPTGPYQLQAAIAAVHDEAPSAEATDWPQITALYEVLMRISDNPVVALNHAVAVGMSRGTQAGLDLLPGLEADPRIAGDHRLHALRAHLLERIGDRAAACASYREAASRATSLPQRRHLAARADRLAAADPPDGGRPGGNCPDADRPVADRPLADGGGADRPVADGGGADRPVADRPVVARRVVDGGGAARRVADGGGPARPVADRGDVDRGGAQPAGGPD
jgi:RNA polymerase sigma factor (sigma-70 family)